jgi:hypothetical protein
VRVFRIGVVMTPLGWPGSFLGWTFPEDRGWPRWQRSVKLHCIAGEGTVPPRVVGAQTSLRE